MVLLVTEGGRSGGRNKQKWNFHRIAIDGGAKCRDSFF
jgi:hypothetical protein